jgi:putative ABC transport system permease protein
MTGFARRASVAARLAWRQGRGAWRHFAVVLASVALGVAAVVAVATLASDLERTLAREAKVLLGGDIELRSLRPLPADAETALARLAAEGSQVLRTLEMVGMARDARGPRTALVEVRAVESGYPLYGRLELEPSRPLDELLAGHGALVGAELLGRLGLHVGERLALGDTQFTIRGVVRREPDRAGSLVTLGPRVLIAAADLRTTGLVGLGSRVRHRVLVRLPETVAPGVVRADLMQRVIDPGVRISAFDEAQPGLRRFFSQLSTYLGLVGLASLLVGGIGVASSVAALVRRQIPTIAILKCLGASSPLLVTTYLVQTGAIALAGAALGVVLGLAVQPAFAALLGGVVPFALETRVMPVTALRGVAMGVLVTLLCALWPLLSIRSVKPALLLRTEVEHAPRHARPWASALPIAAGLAALALWQAGSLKVGGIFLAGAVVALLLLIVLARALTSLARILPRPRQLAWRQGLAGLRRPGGQTVRVVVALGAGAMLLVAVAFLEASLSRQIDHEQRREAPSFFFVDVQPDQTATLGRVLGERAGVTPELTPVVRSRLAAIDGQLVTRNLVEQRRAAGEEELWYYTREYVLTESRVLPATSVITRGHWWTPGEPGRGPWISVEEVAARKLGVGVGSRMTFDIQGVAIEAEVLSLRKVDWQSLTTNFFVIFSPGALDGAPITYVGTARVPVAAEQSVQDDVVAALPNVTAIPVRDILERVSAILGDIAVAVRAIALFTLGAGLVVMVGALTATRYQRLHESAILRTLGATRGAVARAFAVEYACLGVAAGLGGTVLAGVLAWVVLHFVLETPWTFAPGTAMLGVALTTVVAVGVGFLATFRLLGQKPLPVLRQQ